VGLRKECGLSDLVEGEKGQSAEQRKHTYNVEYFERRSRKKNNTICGDFI